MGWNLSYLAVRGVPPAVARERIGVRSTGEFEVFHESDFNGIAIEGGWYVVLTRDLGLIDWLELDAVSAGAELVTCMLSSTVMVSSAACWRDGRRIWSIEHPERGGGEYRLIAEGALPESYASILERLVARQVEADRLNDNVDYIFNVPVDVAGSVTRFDYMDDRPPGTEGDAPWEILERAPRAR